MIKSKFISGDYQSEIEPKVNDFLRKIFSDKMKLIDVKFVVRGFKGQFITVMIVYDTNNEENNE